MQEDWFCIKQYKSTTNFTYKQNTTRQPLTQHCIYIQRYIFIYKGIYLYTKVYIYIQRYIYGTATCFDPVGHPQGLQDHRSKRCLVSLVSVQANSINQCQNTRFKLLKCCPNIYFKIRLTKQRLDLCSWRAWGWPTGSKHVAVPYIPLYINKMLC